MVCHKISGSWEEQIPHRRLQIHFPADRNIVNKQLTGFRAGSEIISPSIYHTHVPQCVRMVELREMNSRQEITTLRHISHPTEMQQYFRLGDRDTISKQNPCSDLV
jgi:hypothetical protein